MHPGGRRVQRVHEPSIRWIRRQDGRCERDDNCSDDELDTIKGRALLADVSFGVAIGAGVATAVLYFTSGGDRMETSSALQVAPTSGGAVVGLSGRW